MKEERKGKKEKGKGERKQKEIRKSSNQDLTL